MRFVSTFVKTVTEARCYCISMCCLPADMTNDLRKTVDSYAKVLVIKTTAISLFIILPVLVILLRTAPIERSVLNVSPKNFSFIHEEYPKVIHQIWLGYDMKNPPEAWLNATDETLRNNPDFSYKRWSAREVMELLESDYPSFIPTYNSYPYNVERADAARYFIIRKYGGIYLDMDEISVVSISEIIRKRRIEHRECMIPAGTPNGITNYVIMCKPQSPFMVSITSQLKDKQGWYGIPYATVMWSTGPRFISGVYDRYPYKDHIDIMPGDEVKKNFVCLFGQTWFSIDGVILHVVVYPFIRLGVAWRYLVLTVVVAVLILIIVQRRLRRRVQPQNSKDSSIMSI